MLFPGRLILSSQQRCFPFITSTFSAPPSNPQPPLRIYSEFLEGHIRLFGERIPTSRKLYFQYVADGLEQGKRPELTGGGLVRSLEGWSVVKDLGMVLPIRKGDKRILGEGEFVEVTLKKAQESLQRRHVLLAKGVRLEQLQAKVSELLEIPIDEIMGQGKERWRVRARSLLCYWAVRELGISMSAMAQETGLSVPAIAKAVQRGEKYAKQEGYVFNWPSIFKS